MKLGAAALIRRGRALTATLRCLCLALPVAAAEGARKLDIARACGIICTPTLVLVSPDGRTLYTGHELAAGDRCLPASSTGGRASLTQGM